MTAGDHRDALHSYYARGEELEFIGLRSTGLPRAHCSVTAAGVNVGFRRRLVPLEEVDRFEIELREPAAVVDDDGSSLGGITVTFGAGRRPDEPSEQLVLLTRSGKAITVPASRDESLGNVALQLNNQQAALRPHDR